LRRKTDPPLYHLHMRMQSCLRHQWANFRFQRTTHIRSYDCQRVRIFVYDLMEERINKFYESKHLPVLRLLQRLKNETHLVDTLDGRAVDILPLGKVKRTARCENSLRHSRHAARNLRQCLSFAKTYPNRAVPEIF
jgi:hypothetical protein